jgi:lipoate-protein ligase A
MRCLFSTSNNPHYNLAMEEFFLKNSNEEFFFLYINEPCIIVGKHQNLLSEINIQYTLENNTKLARRISGGGTVYQDSNNLNFSFIHNCVNLEQVNFTKFTYPILKILREMGLDVVFSGRNDLLIDSKKISGNAMHIFKTRVLSHGTLLFNADLNKLSAALKNSPTKYVDKSIKSVRSKVTNISNYLDNSTSMEKFSQTVFENMVGKSVDSIIKPMTDQETKAINLISKDKFETWEWIYAYSPRYEFHNSFQVLSIIVNLELKVEKGIIKHVTTNSDQQIDTTYQHAFMALENVKHDYRTIFDLLSNDTKISENQALNIEEFCNLLF